VRFVTLNSASNLGLKSVAVSHLDSYSRMYVAAKMDSEGGGSNFLIILPLPHFLGTWLYFTWSGGNFTCTRPDKYFVTRLLFESCLDRPKNSPAQWHINSAHLAYENYKKKINHATKIRNFQAVRHHITHCRRWLRLGDGWWGVKKKKAFHSHFRRLFEQHVVRPKIFPQGPCCPTLLAGGPWVCLSKYSSTQILSIRGIRGPWRGQDL
jgi:hypothetical protein